MVDDHCQHAIDEKGHTRSSHLYRARRIPAHRMQVHASMLVMIDLRRRYGERVNRHRTKIVAALQHLELRMRSPP